MSNIITNSTVTLAIDDQIELIDMVNNLNKTITQYGSSVIWFVGNI
ncbi:unnamed protein product, partial [Adineta ricciae]